MTIAPVRIRGIGEPMLPEVRVRLEQTFAVPVHNQWITSEAGCLGYSCLTGRGMHLNDDLVIVDPDGRALPPGQRAAKIYVTNLFNHALPLIRFEITDPGAANEPIIVHPIVVRSPLGRQPDIVEYQVHQTPRGVLVLVRTAGHVDLEFVQAEIGAGLADLGLTDPEVVLTPVEHLDRQDTEKLKRFIPLPS